MHCTFSKQRTRGSEAHTYIQIPQRTKSPLIKPLQVTLEHGVLLTYNSVPEFVLRYSMTFFFINQNLHDNNIIQLKRGNCFDQWCSYYLLQLQQVLESENRTPKNNRKKLKQISQESCERNPSRSPGALEDRVRHGKICEPGGGKRNNNSVRGITNHHHHKKGLGDPYSVRGLNVEFHITSDKCTLVCTVCHWLRWKTRTL